MKPFQIIQQTAITSLAITLADKSTWLRVKGIVERLEDAEYTGAEKRDYALEQFKVIGLDVAKWLAAVLLELAVTWFRLQVK